MTTAIFGISNDGLNLVVNLFVLMLVVVWLALIVYTYLDAKRRVSDPFLVACATVAAFIPYLGTAVYAILRPPEFLEDAHERELEIKAAELRVRQLEESSCPNCEYPVERTYLRCPHCQRRLKHPCTNCGKPVDPRWSLCPYCEMALPARERRGKRPPEGRKPEEERTAPPRRAPKPAAPKKRQAPARRKAPAASSEEPAPGVSQAPPSPKRTKRSPEREPDPDPRQA
jgi:Double zinc ribbon